ncbi:MAG: DUF6599 family protein [Candidatus Aminicenantales bacterium]
MIAAAFSVLAFIWSGCSGPLKAQAKELPLQAFLPESEELRNWTEDGEPQNFSGEDLFTYIDGGAEIYFEYGFRRVIVQDYRTDAGSRVSLEIFEMDSPDSAYGIYTFKRSQRGEPVSLGDECQLADYYLNLRKGPYLVTITGLDPAADANKALLLLARAIEPKMGPSTRPPSLVSRLPVEGLETQSIKYFKGPLALYNSYPFFREDVFAFQAGVKGEYAPGYSLYIFEYPDVPSARLRFEEAAKSFEQSERYKGFAERQGVYQLKDDRDNWIFATAKGRYVLLLVDSEDEASAKRIFLLVNENLSDS